MTTKKDQFEVKNIRAYSKRCIGCQRHGKAVMMSISPVSSKIYDIKDFFLTKKQARQIYTELGIVLGDNKVPFRENEKVKFFKGEPE